MFHPDQEKDIFRLLKGKKPAEIIGKTVDDQKEPITVVVDSSGLRTTNRGSYIEDKWRKEKRRFVKLHILADRKEDGQERSQDFGSLQSTQVIQRKKFVPPVKEASKEEKQDHKSVWRQRVRCKEEEFQPPGRTGNGTCDQDQKERDDKIPGLSAKEGGNLCSSDELVLRAGRN
jgi:hypothetical protein